MAKTSKSLLNKTRTKKSKKVDKYSEISSIKQEYKHDLRSNVIYVGLMDQYNGLECEIVKRSRRKVNEFYSVMFNGEDVVNDISGNFLMKPEEYQAYLLEKENDNEEDNQNDMTEFEIELIKQGLESYQNYVQCLSPIDWYQMACDRCGFRNRCVCRKKFKYKKLD